MKQLTILLPVAGFIIAVGSALTPRPEPVPFYGYDPDTNICTQGTIEGVCGNGTAIRCTVSLPSGYTAIPAFDVKTGTVCSVAVYRSAGEEPDTLSIH